MTPVVIWGGDLSLTKVQVSLLQHIKLLSNPLLEFPFYMVSIERLPKWDYT